MTEFLPKTDISEAQMAFPAYVYRGFFPPMKIEELMKLEVSRKAKQLAADWFYFGLKKLDAEPKEGIDLNHALRHIRCILMSFEPKHEHKMQAVAYLLDLWFSDFEYERGERKD